MAPAAPSESAQTLKFDQLGKWETSSISGNSFMTFSHSHSIFLFSPPFPSHSCRLCLLLSSTFLLRVWPLVTCCAYLHTAKSSTKHGPQRSSSTRFHSTCECSYCSSQTKHQNFKPYIEGRIIKTRTGP